MPHGDLLRVYADRRDMEGFARIVEQYQRFILATCRRRLRNTEDVDDAVQETFLRLAKKAGEVPGNIGGWLHTCAINVTIDMARRQASRRRHETSAAARLDDSSRELAELREHLDAALAKLEVGQRELIIQRYFVGRPQVELAAEAGVAASTITHRLERAIEMLRGHLKAMGCGVAMVGGLVGLLEAESASAAVGAELTANLMKIGLGGVGTAGQRVGCH